MSPLGSSLRLAIALAVLLYREAFGSDSQGIEFHTIFLPNWKQNDQSTVNLSLTLINSDSSRPANVTINALYFFPNRTFELTVMVLAQNMTEVQLPSDLIWSFTTDGFNGIADQRVHIYSSIPITVIANNFDQSGSGDRYTVFPVSAAGRRYTVSLPDSGSERLNYVQLLAMDRVITNVTMQVIVSGNMTTDIRTVMLDPRPYSFQYYYASSTAFTVYLSSSNGKFAVIAGTSGRLMNLGHFDHQVYMPPPVSDEICPSMIEVTDQLPSTANDETASSAFFVLGPDPNCSIPFTVSSFNGSIDGQIIPNAVIPMVNVGQLGTAVVFASISGYLQVVRISGTANGAGLGASLSIVPSTQQFVTGITLFNSRKPGETLMLIGDNVTAQNVLFDGEFIPSLSHSPLPNMSGYYARTYTVNNIGLHSVQSPGFYSLVLFGGDINAGYAYVPAFNLKPPLPEATTSSSSSSSTTTSITTTTATATATATGSTPSTSIGTGTTPSTTTTTPGSTPVAPSNPTPTDGIDSQGTLFYTVFLPNVNEGDASTVNLSLTLINSNDSFTATVNIDGVYFENGVFSLTVTVDPLKSTTVAVPSSFIWQFSGQGLQQQPDQRIRIVASSLITVIASNIDQSGSGDRYIVPPVTALGSRYSVAVPGPGTSTRKSFFYFVPVEGTVTVNLQVYYGNIAPNPHNFTIGSTFGAEQYYFAYTGAFSAYLTVTGGRLAIVAGTSGRQLASFLPPDHQAFMPLPVTSTDCSTPIIDIHPTNANDGTTSRFFVIGPTQDCAVPYIVSGNGTINDATPLRGAVGQVDVSGLSNRITFTSSTALTQVTRIQGGNNGTLYGASLTIVPSLSQFVFGTTLFQTYGDGDFIQGVILSVSQQPVLGNGAAVVVEGGLIRTVLRSTFLSIF